MVLKDILIVVGIVGIVYVTIRTNQIRAKETHRIKSAIPKHIEPRKNERWEKIQTHITSDNPNDWRLAIIEAAQPVQVPYNGESMFAAGASQKPTIFKGGYRPPFSEWIERFEEIVVALRPIGTISI